MATCHPIASNTAVYIPEHLHRKYAHCWVKDGVYPLIRDGSKWPGTMVVISMIRRIAEIQHLKHCCILATQGSMYCWVEAVHLTKVPGINVCKPMDSIGQPPKPIPPMPGFIISGMAGKSYSTSPMAKSSGLSPFVALERRKLFLKKTCPFLTQAGRAGQPYFVTPADSVDFE